jgi:hypothetical protein
MIRGLTGPLAAAVEGRLQLTSSASSSRRWRPRQEARVEADIAARRESVYPYLRCAAVAARRGADGPLHPAVLYDRKIVLLGSSEFLRIVAYGDGAPAVVCHEPVTEEAFRVNITPDGTLAVSAHGDGTIRWHRIVWDDRSCSFRLLLSVRFARNASGKPTWIAWRPDGRHAQDAAIREGLEWQALDPSGRVTLTPFERLQGWYDPDTIKTALGVPVQKRTDVLDRDHVVTRAARQPVIEVLGNPRSDRAETSALTLGLDSPGSPLSSGGCRCASTTHPLRSSGSMSDTGPARIFRSPPSAWSKAASSLRFHCR